MQSLFAMIFYALRWHDLLDLIPLQYLHVPFCTSYFEFVEHVKTVMPTTSEGHTYGLILRNFKEET